MFKESLLKFSLLRHSLPLNWQNTTKPPLSRQGKLHFILVLIPGENSVNSPLIFKKLGEIINNSINETLSRTLLTSSTTLIVVVILFLMGGGVIHDFAFAMLIGVLVGTYSSIFVASPIILFWEGKLTKENTTIQ